MTTAARPTWAPAKGGQEQGGTRIFGPSQKYSSRDMASHTTLKPRKEGQDTQDEVQRRNLRDELEDRERRHFGSKDKSFSEDRDRRRGSGQLLLEGAKREVEERIVPRSIDADDSDVDVKSDEESDEDEDEDDTEALLAELERIKKDRAEEKLRKEKEKQEEELKVKEAELMRGNPLINANNSTNFSVKRRWDDDVVFKNQTRGESKAPKRFINDTIRNDFHRKFLHKYMKPYNCAARLYSCWISFRSGGFESAPDVNVAKAMSLSEVLRSALQGYQAQILHSLAIICLLALWPCHRPYRMVPPPCQTCHIQCRCSLLFTSM